MTTKQWVSIGICGFSVFLFVVSLPVSPGWAWVLLLIGGSIGGVVYAAAYGEKHAGKVQPPALPVQPPAPTAAPKTTRKRMSATGVLLMFMALGLVFLIVDPLPHLMRDLQLMRSSAVTRGTVVSIGSCGGGGDSGTYYHTYDVQFVDNKGQTQVENISQCDSTIGDLSVGDSIPILYAPDDPTAIAAQGGFADQVQFDESVVVVVVVFIIGMALAILLIQLRHYLMVHQKLGPAQGNWLIARIKESKVAVSFSENVLCRIGIHQGEWTTEGCSGCWQRRFCIFCGKPQNREVHNWPPKAVGQYFKDGSCEKRITCLHCEKTKSIGIDHEGEIGKTDDLPWWYFGYSAACKRCGKNLREDYGD